MEKVAKLHQPPALLWLCLYPGCSTSGNKSSMVLGGPWQGIPYRAILQLVSLYKLPCESCSDFMCSGLCLWDSDPLGCEQRSRIRIFRKALMVYTLLSRGPAHSPDVFSLTWGKHLRVRVAIWEDMNRERFLQEASQSTACRRCVQPCFYSATIVRIMYIW